jgi:SAM-dependent methyltransferase
VRGFRKRNTETDADTTREIDVNDLLARYSVEQLADAAEQYFAQLGDWHYHLAKPYASTNDAAHFIVMFGAMLNALDCAPRDTILDFGAGSCWTSMAFAQMGCRVIACDVSATGLDIGRELLRRHPLIGDVPEPQFLLFDGHKLELPDESVDHISCKDAFHHVPNANDVLREFFRVLRPGGRAVFSEPGPRHSHDPQSQTEMRNFMCVERDIDVEAIADEASAIGFGDVRVGVYSPMPYFVGARDFERELRDGAERMADATRHFHINHRLFVLDKPGESANDSRRRAGLRADLDVTLAGTTAHVRIVNTSDQRWLASGSLVGSVNLGIHLFDDGGRLVDLDFQRVPLRENADIAPGEVVDLSFELAPMSQLAPGEYRLEFDLVAEHVAWFADNGGATVVRPITVGR